MENSFSQADLRISLSTFPLPILFAQSRPPHPQFHPFLSVTVAIPCRVISPLYALFSHVLSFVTDNHIETIKRILES